MSNAVGLVAGGVSGTWGYRAELGGQWDRLRWQVPASLAGAVLGAFLLLHLPEKVFIQIVPVLLILALVLVVAGRGFSGGHGGVPRSRGGHPKTSHREEKLYWCSLPYLVGIYEGYFTAAQGLLLVGVMGALLPESVQRMNAANNLGRERSLRRLAMRWWPSIGSAGPLPELSQWASWSGHVMAVGCRQMHCAP